MIEYRQGNLLEAPAEALVNAVNTVGVMGKGIALMLKSRFKMNYHLYADACKAKQVQIGKMFVTEVMELEGPRWIINFPRKQHWRDPSRFEWISEGLMDLRSILWEKNIQSVGLPALGCGNGGLEWDLVKAEIESSLAGLDIRILVYEPRP